MADFVLDDLGDPALSTGIAGDSQRQHRPG